MTRKECLDAAAECVLKDRQNVYGKPEDCFGMIAKMWGAYLGVCVSAHDVAAMMALLKIARFRHNPLHEDNAVDCAGYAACMVETATAWKREGEDEAEGGCCQNGNDQPKFKEGEAVQYTYEDPSSPEARWLDAWYVQPFVKKGEHVLNRGGMNHFVHDEGRIRSKPKEAEGCEEPKFKPGDRVRVFFCGKEAQNGIYLGEGPEGMKSWTCRVKTDDGKEGVCAKSIVKKLDWACSEQEFKFGDKVQADIGPNGKWEDAIYCRKDLDGMYLVKHDIDDEIVFQAREVRPCSMPKAEGCEDLVQRIKDVNPAIYGGGTEEA